MEYNVSLSKLPTQAWQFSNQYLDLGFRCPVQQSSSYDPRTSASVLYPAISPGSFFFHTALEESPWIIVDLEAVRRIGQIKIWNREGAGQSIPERAKPLVISISNDQQSWADIAQWNESFGGRLERTPLCVSFPLGAVGRYIKFQVPRLTYLHFDYIEIVQLVPNLVFGFICDLRKNADNDVVCDYVSINNFGFYSGCSTVLQDIVTLAKSAIKVNRIDLTNSFLNFKDGRYDDVYSLLFKLSSGNSASNVYELCRVIAFDAFDVHKHYKHLPLDQLHKIVEALFWPSDAVMKIADAMLSTSNIVPEETISIVYRGTDKHTEVSLASIDAYIEVAANIKRAHPSFRVLIQTDQEQARDRVVECFGSECVYFEEMPVTAGSVVIHELPDLHKARGRLDFCMKLMAAVILASKCRYTVLHTGNVAAWLAMYRGHADRLYQFDASGRLVPP